jgi:hypothetical protein
LARSFGIALALVVAVGAVLRVRALGDESLWHDELLALEDSAGRGFAHGHVPHGTVIEQPPRPTRLLPERPWWTVWTSLGEDTHPPLYFLTLRAWRGVFGDGEAAVRGVSVVFSLLALLALYQAVRGLSGPPAGLWAAALFAVSPLQIRYAQEARSYTLALFFTLGAAAALVSMEDADGMKRGRALLASCLVGAALTHYFALPVLAALLVYAVLALRGSARRHALLAFAAGALVSIAAWGPFALAQRGNLVHAFLVEQGSGHVGRTLVRALAGPLWLLTGSGEGPGRFDALLGSILIVTVVALARGRGRLLGALWLAGYVLAIAGLDLARSTRHLAYARYTVLAGPGLYALVAAAVPVGAGAWRHLAPAAAMLAATIGIARGYPAKPEWREVGALVAHSLRPREVLVFSFPGGPDWYPAAMFLAVSHYAGERMPPVLLVSEAVRPDVVARVGQPGSAWVLSAPNTDPLALLGPGCVLQRFEWPSAGVLSRVRLAGEGACSAASTSLEVTPERLHGHEPRYRGGLAAEDPRAERDHPETMRAQLFDLGRFPAPGRSDQQEDARRRRRLGRDRGAVRAFEEEELRALEGLGQKPIERLGRRDHRDDRAPALLGGPARDLVPAVLPRALERGPRCGVGARGDHRTHLGHAQLGGLLDHELHPVALERRHREDDVEGRFRPRLYPVPEMRGDRLARDLVERRLVFLAGAVEHVDDRARAQAEDLPCMVRAPLRQRHARSRGRALDVEARDRHQSDLRTTSPSHSPSVRASTGPSEL